jgi:SsrA-binding protein
MHLYRNRVKVELGLGRGKREYDKRYALAEREARRQMERGVRRDWKSAV